MAKYPMIKKLGSLPPCSKILNQVKQPGFYWDEFTNNTPYPKELSAFIEANGYVFDDYGQGMLFASKESICMHTDELPSVIWVLATKPTRKKHHEPLCQLVTDKGHVTLAPGDVYIVDTSKPHGVLNTGMAFVLVSIYVRQMTKAELKRSAAALGVKASGL